MKLKYAIDLKKMYYLIHSYISYHNVYTRICITYIYF